MSSNGFIKGKPAIKNPPISIAPNGLKYAEELEQAHFEITGEPIFTNFIEMTISECCELIFQKHKQNSSFSLLWTRNTFKPNTPRNVNPAKDIMLLNKVLIQASIQNTTILHEFVHGANSYAEALKIMEDKTKPPSTYSISTYGPNSPAVGSAGRFKQTISNREPPKNFLEKIWDDMRNAVVSHIIVGAISLITGGVVRTVWLSPKSSQSTSQQKQENNTNSFSSNKDSTSLDNIKQ